MIIEFIIMKNRTTLSLLIVVLTSCAVENIYNPEFIGKQVFGMVEYMDTDKKQEYLNEFMSNEEYAALFIDRHEDFGDKLPFNDNAHQHEKKASLIKEDFTNRIEEDYKNLIESANKYGIDWKTAEYLHFEFEVNEKHNRVGCFGDLYFKYNNIPFKLETTSFAIEEEYHLFMVDKLISLEDELEGLNY